MLRKIRITVASIVLVLITLLFLDFTGTIHTYLGWLAKIQFLPAVFALNFGIIAIMVILTLIMGRIYCSVICPLGIMQDVIARFNRKKNRYSYSPAINWLRIAMMILLIIAIILGIGSVISILAPYGTFGLIIINLLRPVYLWINNLLALIAEHYESYMFYSKDVWIHSLPTFIVALVLFIAIFILSWRNGRTYCNTICPVGTLLGFIAKYSRLKIVINENKCKGCGKCERNCKAACIDSKNRKIDYTRCVTCGNCLSQCSFNAIAYGHKATIEKENKIASEFDKQSTDTGRRNFVVGATIAVATAAIAQEKKKVDGGLAVIEDKIKPDRVTRLTPAGSISASNMHHKCTSCQLCVSKCPNDVLIPSSDLITLMQPEMSYENGYCRPECNVCSQVCPTGAIRPITLAEKSSTQIGHAVWIKKNCLAVTDGISCGNCAEHCPAGAIIMIPQNGNEELPKIPAINAAACIGCGACEYLCPARPFSAIYVEGKEVHTTN